MAPTTNEPVEPAEAIRLSALGFQPGRPIARITTDAFGYGVTEIFDVLRRTTTTDPESIVVPQTWLSEAAGQQKGLLMAPTSMVAVPAFERQTPPRRGEHPDWYFEGILAGQQLAATIEVDLAAHLLLRRQGRDSEWLFQSAAARPDKANPDKLVYLAAGTGLELTT